MSASLHGQRSFFGKQVLNREEACGQSPHAKGVAEGDTLSSKAHSIQAFDEATEV